MKTIKRFAKIIQRFAFCFTLLISLHSFSQSLDSSFGVNGEQVIFEGNTSVAINSAFSTSQGNILMDATITDDAGYFPNTNIYKLKGKGIRDNSFGVEGLVQLNGFGGKMIGQPDGKILVTWSHKDRNFSTYDSFFVARFLANGQYDSTFGKGGKTAFHKKSNVSNAIALKSNGDIVITGNITTAQSGGAHVAIIQLLPNGKLDPGFGAGGFLFAKTAYENNGLDIKVLSSDKIVVGYIYNNGSSAIAQYMPDGTLDSTVGVNGFIVNNNTGVAHLSITVANNKLIEVTNDNSQTIVRRFYAKGGVDNSFGTGGSSTLSPYYQVNISIRQNGDFYLTKAYPFVVTQFLPNGAVDSAYGSNGSVSADFNGFFTSAYPGAYVPLLQPNGRLVAAGVADDDDNGSYYLAFAAFKSATNPSLIADFNAVKNVRSVSLNWHPAGALNTACFTVERAGDKQVFSPIANISAKQISTVGGNYNFADVAPAGGINNYRIKQVLTDGSIAYSKMIAVSFDAENTIMATPNPAHDIVHVTTAIFTPLQVKLLSSEGKTLKTFIVNSKYDLNITELKPGIYFLYIPSLQKSIKLVKE